jgi:hypothetical protein
MKSIFKSKTAALGFVTTLAGIVGVFVPEVAAWTADNASAILAGVGTISIILRLVTKDKVSLFP